MVTLLLVAALTPQSPLAVQTVQPEQGPTVLVHHQAGPLLALRLSAPVPVELPEGSVELLQELARPGAEATAREHGARVELRHERGRAVVAVTGPAAAFDALVSLLREVTGEPDLSIASLRRARARAEDRVLARLEQPAPRIRRLLRHGLYGGPEPNGIATTLLDPEAVRRLRERLYDRLRLRVTLVGSIPTAVIGPAFREWPTPGPAAPLPPPTGSVAARPQAHREWGGIAFLVTGDAAVLAVAAELVRQRVDASALRLGTAEAWHEPRPALVLIGAAMPGDNVLDASSGAADPAGTARSAALRRYLHGLVAEAAAVTGPDAVAGARTALRRRLLLEARTAAGKAEVIGRVADEAGPGGAEAFLDRLARVTPEEVRRLLDRVRQTPAVAAEAR